MKTTAAIISLVILLFLAIGCKKDSTTNPTPTITIKDIDGNTYTTVKIGTQTWMVENLKVTKYRNGDPIPNVTNANLWMNTTIGAYCWYDNNIQNKILYGALYNWYAIKDSRNIAPIGWHVSTDADWTILTTFLGGESVAGNKLREKGTAHWMTPNTGATNEFGFNGLPGGISSGGIFDTQGMEGAWWSNITTTPTDHSDNWHRMLWYDDATVSKSHDLFQTFWGFSVRCVKD